jgi:hypothetical protein
MKKLFGRRALSSAARVAIIKTGQRPFGFLESLADEDVTCNIK